jgi:BirA family biotin operon repressor/biotin-[acetyl-CoA-carboxylase] ligase
MLASPNYKSFLGQIKMHLSSVDSTNNYAANLLKEGLIKHGTVILADEQTNGRGQRGAIWQSELGMNLQMSLILIHKNLGIVDQRFINSFVSVATIKFLGIFGVKAKIKWPNDILVDEKKIAGILIENQLNKQQISSTIIGIGLNINQANFGNLTATSLKNEIGSFVPIPDALDSLLLQLNVYFDKFEKYRYSELEKLYFDDLWGFQKVRRFSDKNGIFKGTITGISESGLLIIQTNEGKKEYDIKEVNFLLEEQKD